MVSRGSERGHIAKSAQGKSCIQAAINRQRPHPGRGNRLLLRPGRGPTDGEVVCESRLGGLLRHYYREAG